MEKQPQANIPESPSDSASQLQPLTSSPPPTKSFNFSVLFFGFIGALVIAFLIFYGLVVSQTKKLSAHPVILTSAALLHIPAVRAEGETLSYVDYRSELNSVQKLSSNPTLGFGSVSEQDLSDLVVVNFLAGIKAQALAQKYKVEVTSAELEQEKNNLITQLGEAQVKKNVSESYGWDIDTFVKKVIEPSLLKLKVQEAFMTDPTASQFTRQEAKIKHILVAVENPTDAQQKVEKKKAAETLLGRLKRGEDFAKLAKEFSDDSRSKVQGGELGWIARGQTVPPFDAVAFSIEPKKLSSLIETDFGYHIIMVDERRIVPDFDAFMDSEIKKMDPKFFIPIHNPLEGVELKSVPATSTSARE